MKTIEFKQTLKVHPQERAKQIFQIYTTGNYNKEDILTLMDMYIKQSQFGNYVEAIPYWDKDRNEAKKLQFKNY